MLTTLNIISDVFEHVGRPGADRLAPSTICVKMWAVLGLMQNKLGLLSARQSLLGQYEFSTSPNVDTYSLAGLPTSYGERIGLDRLLSDPTSKARMPIPLVMTLAEAQTVGQDKGMAAFVSTDALTNLRNLIFVPAPTDVMKMRFWYVPGKVPRPGLEANPQFPDEWIDLITIKTAKMCLADCGYSTDDVKLRLATIEDFESQYEAAWEQWRGRDESSDNTRRAFNERRRRVGSYGGWWF